MSRSQHSTPESQATFKGFTLNTFQVRAAAAIERGANVLLSAPTGSGKTLVAEYAIDLALQNGRRAIYTAPIKALSSQKYRDFQNDGVDVGLMTGDLTLNAQARVLIMTTEIFRNSVFEDPERFRDVAYAIFDEIHYLDDPSRGTVWEESLIFAPDHMRFIGLSATIDNLEQFGRWIREVRRHDLEVIEHRERPVPLDHQLYHAATGLFRVAQRKRAIQAMHRSGQRQQPPGRRRPQGRRPVIQRGPRPYALLLDLLQKEKLAPILYFCFSRKECEIKADKNLHRRLLPRRDHERMKRLFVDVCRRFELDPSRDPILDRIHHRARQGIAYHHAGMLPIHKEVVERLFTSGMLRLLFTTETFALGINMPARTVVFDSLMKYDGVSMDYMRARDYLQMAGRAGRQGIDDEGLVVAVLDDEDLLEAPLGRYISGKVEPVMSRFNLSYATIINLYERMGMDLLGAYDKSFAAFQAAQGGRKSKEKKRAAARATLEMRIGILVEAGYLEDDGILPRGQIAQQINGYEIQVTELLFAGVLDGLSFRELPVVFAALVHESRRREDARFPRRAGPSMARDVDTAVRRFVAIELLHKHREHIKLPDFGVAAAVDSWARGGTVADMEREARSDAGDVVRTLRLAIQMMRQLRKAIGRGYDLAHRLEEAIVCVNRDEVDARRQFELG